MSAADRLDEIEARANAATEGPWATVAEDGAILSLVLTDENDGLFYGDSGYDAPITTETGDDAEFIAHARTDVPALVAALRAVLDLHVATEGHLCDGAVCLECTTFGDVEVPLPCATVRAIEEALS